MRQRALLMLVLACVMGGAAVYLARGWLERQVRTQIVTETAQAPAPVAMSTVVVAKIPLRFGDEIRRENVREIPWPSDNLPDGSFQTVDQILTGGERRVALRDIGTNEMVLASRVSGFGGRATLSAIVAQDMRAITIRVNDVLGVAGFVLPGDRVDVVMTRSEEVGNTRSPPIAEVLLQNVKVLAVDQVADSQKDKPVPAKAVTLEVSTADAQRVALASRVGELSLALRHAGSVALEPVGRVTVADLSGFMPMAEAIPATITEAAPDAAEPAPIPVSRNIRILRGLDETIQPVMPHGMPLAPTPIPVDRKPAARQVPLAWAEDETRH